MPTITGAGMTAHSRPRSNSRREFLKGLAVAFWLVMSARSDDTYGKEKTMNPSTMTLWQVIDAQPQIIPFTQANVEMLFATTLSEKRRSTHTLFLEGGDVPLAQASRIAKIDLRLGFEAGDLGFMVLSLDGACISLDQVRRHFEDLQITEAPRGRSMDEETSYSVMMPWGKLSFGFAQRNPNCLASIVFNPQKSQ